ncbi:MAG: hypothetical protein V4492_05255 [Chlamydiota bacterium]
MLILPRTKISVDDFLGSAVRLGGYALAALFCACALFFFFYPWGTDSVQETVFSRSQRSGALSYPYEAIGSGGLTLNRRHALGWVSRIADDLSLIAYNGRPNVPATEAQLLLNFKASRDQTLVLNGKPLFLQEMDQGKGLSISSEESGLWIKPILLENGTVLVEACRNLLTEEGSKIEEKGQFFMTAQGGVPARLNPSQEMFMLELKASQFHSSDFLIQKYGGTEYAGWRSRAVLELASGSRTYACFVAEGDYLCYRDGEWQVVAKEDLPEGRPVACVHSITGRVVQLEAWDAAGFHPLQLKIAESDRDSYFQIKPENLPAKVRLRSSTQVSCALGKRRVILRQGDWLLKTATGWRNVRKVDELQQLLYFRMKGELLIFDGIERQQGRLVMKGHCFNGSRTQMQPFSIPIESDKAPSKSKRKKASPDQTKRVA